MGTIEAATYSTLQVENDTGVATITLQRPEQLNALNSEMIRDLDDVCRRLTADQTIRAIVFTGGGRAFCAGADITELAELEGPHDFLALSRSIQGVLDQIDQLDRPTIAALNGPALGGGCELALACDFRLISAGGVIGLPEIKIGVLPAAGGTQRLPRLVPQALAKRMLYFGDTISAEEALAHGLVNEIAPVGEVLATAVAWARRLSAMPVAALGAAKSLVRIAADADLRTGLLAEQQAVAMLFATDDRQEGMAAFLEKREAHFGPG